MTERPGDQRQFRRPESVLVIVHTTELECLLLERLDPAGFWQSVTGSLHWDESPAEAAAREVREETGIEAAGLTAAGVSRSFSIFPQWLDRYQPGVTQNTEHLWFMELAAPQPVRLSQDEHRAWQWLPLREAIEVVSSWTNREGLEWLAQHKRATGERQQ